MDDETAPPGAPDPGRPVRVSALLSALGTRAGRLQRPPVPTGFDLVDDLLSGGVRPTDLLLLGGAPGVGKTVMALQMAGNAAAAGRRVTYVCYEHDPSVLLGRLLLSELPAAARDVAGAPVTADDPGPVDPASVGLMQAQGRIRQAVIDGAADWDEVRDDALVDRAGQRVAAYADRLRLVRATGVHTDLAAIEALLDPPPAAGHGDTHHGQVLVVDYLQKVGLRERPATDEEAITRIVEGLKDLALRRGAVVVAVVAADRSALGQRRVRLDDLRGSSALAYECDIALLLNNKVNAVAKAHLAYDAVRAAAYADYVVCSLEKNRGGPADVSVEFRKDFVHYRFDPRGTWVNERLTDDRLEE